MPVHAHRQGARRGSKPRSCKSPGAARKKHSYFQAQFLRLKSRRGPKKAILAVAASILTAAYYILKDGETYHELGADYFERRDKAHIARRLIRRLEQLGLSVEVRPAA